MYQNPQIQKALRILESNKNLFLTGKAGTGKSTLLEYFRENSTKKMVVLAPTGVAALNVKGQTIHSFFRLKPGFTEENIKKLPESGSKIYKQLEMIIIDEISMVRADLLDMIDKFLRLNGPNQNKPFGGIQMVFIGDLFQLPPVVIGSERLIFSTRYNSEYFFSADVFQDLDFEFLELLTIYRQTDQDFIQMLSDIRNGDISNQQVAILNSNLKPNFSPDVNDFYITLTTTNSLAGSINDFRLTELTTKTYLLDGTVSGDFDDKYLPTEKTLVLKPGAQIMMVTNDVQKRFVNGSVGKIISIGYDVDLGENNIDIELDTGASIKVSPYTWEIYKFSLNEQTQKIESRPVGTFTQFPLKLAWALTIHKAQGKTFDKVIIDVGHGTFAGGQMYVALSRARSLEGIVLKKPIQINHIFADQRIRNFYAQIKGEFVREKLED